MMEHRHWLFSYGTLRQAEVQRKLFGRLLDSVPDVLPGFRLELLPITDRRVVELSGLNVHPVLRRAAGDEAVEGCALGLTAEDLRRADSYEVSDYVRIQVVLKSGKSAFVYVHRDDAGPPATA